MLVIAGLGNPGRMYQGTRHNIGYDVAESIVRQEGVAWKDFGDAGLIAIVRRDAGDALLFKPMTYMNNSGGAVLQLLDHHGLSPGDILAVYDDFQLPLGVLRLRQRGSDGGHNGMASLIAELGTEEIPRLRCGIGSASMPADKSLMSDYVLSTFLPEEVIAAKVMTERAVNACLAVLNHGFVRAMNEFNTSPPGSEPDGKESNV